MVITAVTVDMEAMVITVAMAVTEIRMEREAIATEALSMRMIMMPRIKCLIAYM